jgi:type I restriction enzyme, S subunit
MHDNVALGGDLNVIRSSHYGVFISYYLNGQQRAEIARIAQGDTVVHLYSSQLKLLKIALPTSKEQQKIADCLSSIDELITLETQKLNTFKTHKKGLMQQLFPALDEVNA